MSFRLSNADWYVWKSTKDIYRVKNGRIMKESWTVNVQLNKNNSENVDFLTPSRFDPFQNHKTSLSARLFTDDLHSIINCGPTRDDIGTGFFDGPCSPRWRGGRRQRPLDLIENLNFTLTCNRFVRLWKWHVKHTADTNHLVCFADR